MKKRRCLGLNCDGMIKVDVYRRLCEFCHKSNNEFLGGYGYYSRYEKSEDDVKDENIKNAKTILDKWRNL